MPMDPMQRRLRQQHVMRAQDRRIAALQMDMGPHRRPPWAPMGRHLLRNRMSPLSNVSQEWKVQGSIGNRCDPAIDLHAQYIALQKQLWQQQL